MDKREIPQNPTFEESKALILKAKDDFQLSSKEMSAILTNSPKGYLTYKKWVTDGNSSRQVPSSPVFAHLTTLYKMFDDSKETARRYLKQRALRQIQREEK